MIQLLTLLAAFVLGLVTGYIYGWGTHSEGTPSSEIEEWVAVEAQALAEERVSQLQWQQFRAVHQNQFERDWLMWNAANETDGGVSVPAGTTPR